LEIGRNFKNWGIIRKFDFHKSIKVGYKKNGIMIKTIVTPQNNKLSLSIPDSYIGREIEVLLYARDELQEEKAKPKRTMAHFNGILSETDYQSLKDHTEQARKEWNRAI
jgi:hypothetical protein